MKALLTRRTVVIASVAVLIAIITIISVNVFDTSGPVTGLVNIVSRPLRNGVSQVARVFEGIYASAYRFNDLMEEYEKALIDYNELVQLHQEALELAEENNRLRALLGFRERHTGYDHEAATIIDWGVSMWSSSFTINVGYANSTIVRGNGVVTESGMLIGQVSDVGPTQSVVVSILDTTFSAGANIGDGGGLATAKGDFALVRSGLLMLDAIDDDLVILPGDSVVTSGRGNVFPAGLVMGEVVDVLRHTTGVGRYATVKPIRELGNIRQVIVITAFEITD